jgi:hypothetical protein
MDLIFSKLTDLSIIYGRCTRSCIRHQTIHMEGACSITLSREASQNVHSATQYLRGTRKVDKFALQTSVRLVDSDICCKLACEVVDLRLLRCTRDASCLRDFGLND